MSNIKIYKDIASGLVYFEGSRVRPQPLNKIAVTAHPTQPDRIRITRTDRFKKDGITPKIKFARLHFNRVRDINNNSFATRAEAIAHIEAVVVQSAPADVDGDYLGIWNPTTNTPDIFDAENQSAFVAGDMYKITASGTHNSIDYNAGDTLIWNAISSSFDLIASVAPNVEQLENSAVNEFDLVLDPNYSGLVQNGSAFRPYTDLATLLSNSTANQNILIKGENIIASTVTLPHALNLFGAEGAVLKFASYDSTSGDLISFEGNGTEEMTVQNIIFKNAGGYGLKLKKLKSLRIANCEFYNNGWNGTQLNTAAPSSLTGLLGYDSTQTELQNFYASSNASNGGAMRIEEVAQPVIRENIVKNNLRGIRLQDCGVNGAGFIIENQVSNNIESGIYLAAGSTFFGCQNITVAVNYSAYNANNGLLCIGGLNNKFSQNEVNNNWNAGFCAFASGNCTLRDGGLYNNNKSSFNGIGNNGDAMAAVQYNDASSYLAVNFALSANYRYLLSVNNVQVHNTLTGTNAQSTGVYFADGLNAIAYNSKNIVNIDNVEFIGQSAAIDMSDITAENLNISIGDNAYINVIERVKEPISGKYFELPFSNHVTTLSSADVSVSNTGNIKIVDGNGSVLNPYKVNELQAEAFNSEIQVYLKDSKKIQFRVAVANCKINGSFVNSVLNLALVQLNNLFTNTAGFSSGGNPVTAFSLVNNDLVLTLQDNTSYTVDVTTLGVDENKFVSSGALNGSNLELTMSDSSIVSIDASNMVNGSTLPAISNDFYISYGSRAGEQITSPSIVNDLENKQPFYNADFLKVGEEYIWTHDTNATYILGIYSGAEQTYDSLDITFNAKWTVNFKFYTDGSSVQKVRETSVGVDVASRFANGYAITNNTVFALRYGNDNYLYLYDISGGEYTLIGKSNSVLTGSEITVSFAGGNQPNAKFPNMIKRFEAWEIEHDFDSSETEIFDGIEDDTVLKSNVQIEPGQKAIINLNHEGKNLRIGLGYTGANTGVSNAFNNLIDAFVYGSAEQIIPQDTNDWTFNASAVYYVNSARWGRGSGLNAGLVSIRYNSNNSVDLYSETYGELIASKVTNLNGSAFSVHVAASEVTPFSSIPSVSKQTIGQGSQPLISFAPDVSNQSFDVTEDQPFSYQIVLDSNSDIVNMYAQVNDENFIFVNQETGVITGTAPPFTNSNDSYTINCKAGNAIGGVTNFTVTVNVLQQTYTNTKSLLFQGGVNSYLGGNAGNVTALERSSNGTGSADAWTIAFWWKPGTSSTGQTLFYFGSSDTANNGFIEIKQVQGTRIRLRYGSNNNHLQIQTPTGNLPNSTWSHVLVSYNGGTTGASSGSISTYYSRFKIFINGVQQTTTNSQNNFGWSGSIVGQNYRFGRLTSGNYPNNGKLNQLAIFDSDQSSNVSGLYNGGQTQDISQLVAGSGNMNTQYLQPSHYYEIETSTTTIQDLIGNAHFVGYNFVSSDLVTDAP